MRLRHENAIHFRGEPRLSLYSLQGEDAIYQCFVYQAALGVTYYLKEQQEYSNPDEQYASTTEDALCLLVAAQAPEQLMTYAATFKKYPVLEQHYPGWLNAVATIKNLYSEKEERRTAFATWMHSHMQTSMVALPLDVTSGPS